MAYETNESGTSFEIIVQPFPKPNARWQVSTAGGTQARWRYDGKELYFIAPDRKLMAVPVAVLGTALEPGKPVPLFATQIASFSGTAFKPQYAVSRDGRFVINQAMEESTPTPSTLILNWNPELRK